MAAVTAQTHPFQVGRMVYETLDEAIEKAKLALVDYPEARSYLVVTDRRPEGGIVWVASDYPVES